MHTPTEPDGSAALLLLLILGNRWHQLANVTRSTLAADWRFYEQILTKTAFLHSTFKGRKKKDYF
jgi:hypothetical protein